MNATIIHLNYFTPLAEPPLGPSHHHHPSAPSLPSSVDITARRGLNPVGRHAELRHSVTPNFVTLLLLLLLLLHRRSSPHTSEQRDKLPDGELHRSASLFRCEYVSRRNSRRDVCVSVLPVCALLLVFMRAVADLKPSCTCCTVAETPTETLQKWVVGVLEIGRF